MKQELIMKDERINVYKGKSNSSEDRLVHLLRHLGISQAHFVGCDQLDFEGFVNNYPEMITSFTVVCPRAVDISLFSHMITKLLIIIGEKSYRIVERGINRFPDIAQHILPDFGHAPWTDVIKERTDEIETALRDFIERIDHSDNYDRVKIAEGRGEYADLVYEVQGRGTPIVFLPMALSPSQWKPLLPRLAEHYCVINVGGPAIGYALSMEERGNSPGYMKLFSDLIDNMSIQEGENILDIGCGTGALDRYLAQLTERKNPILGLDINPHLVEIAKYLVEKEKLVDFVEFQTGNGEKLPFSDNSYSVTISTTVMEEANADKMLSDMIRVTKTGGRIGVIIRAEDMPVFINIDVRPELKAKFESIRQRPEEPQCFTASLYKRFHRSGLTNIKMIPQMVVLYDANGRAEKFMQAFFLSRIKREEQNEWIEALNKSASDGTFFITWPHHCAIGTKAG